MNPRGPMQSVVGVVNDAKQTSPRDRAMGVVYLPMRDSLTWCSPSARRTLRRGRLRW